MLEPNLLARLPPVGVRICPARERSVPEYGQTLGFELTLNVACVRFRLIANSKNPLWLQ